MGVVARLDQYASILVAEFDETNVNNLGITGLGTCYSSEFSENIGIVTTNTANVFTAYDQISGEFADTLYGPGNGTYMRQNTDKSVIVYNEIDEITDLFGRGIVRDGLVLDLDAGISASYVGSGITWTDLSGNGNNGTLAGGVGYSASNGGALVFDGTDDKVDTFNVSSLTDMTIEMWIYDTRSSGDRDILSYNGNSGSYTFNGSTFRTDGNGLVGRSFAGVGNPPLNTWYRFCYVKNGDLYINQTQYTGSGTDNPYGTLSFANTRGDVNNKLNGRISSVKVYNRALTAAEISQNYNALKHRFGL